jgi:hydrogenase maturation protease
MELPDGVDVYDFGIGGIHMVQSLLEESYDALVIVDCADRGRPPGTIMIIEPDVLDVHELSLIDKYDYLADMHYTNPERALALARALNVLPERFMMVGIQPYDAETLSETMSPVVETAAQLAADEVVAVARALAGGAG